MRDFTLAFLPNNSVLCGMSLFVTALNSGSNGNCFYIGNDKEAVLVDVGISCRETERRMDRLGLSMKKVKAIFISHEHTDHVRGLRVLAKKYQLPVYSTLGTLRDTHLNPEHPFNHTLTPYHTVNIGALEITAFPKCHDAHDPQSFVVRHNEVCVGVLTDIGEVCDHVVKHFKCCHAIFLETNYDKEMLMSGRYPYHLKRRIDGRFGHLSNEQALELFRTHRSPLLSHLFLSHLSKENNDPDLVYRLFEPHAEGVEVIVTSRDSEIPLYHIHNRRSRLVSPSSAQLSLFS
jgi:phosphoribosyl 1,2-cyclic phosphodiesterase